eukprot:9611658-Alexandrium_andersonii.AAC.1
MPGVGGLALLHAREEKRLVDVLLVRPSHRAVAGLVLPEELVGVSLGDDAGVLGEEVLRRPLAQLQEPCVGPGHLAVVDAR